MKKIAVIAVREYRAMVQTKAFLVSLIMMPILMLGSLAAVELLKNAGEIEERKIVVLDPDNRFFDELARLAEAGNAAVQAREAERTSKSGDSKSTEENGGIPQMARGELIFLEKYNSSSGQNVTDEVRVELSQRVRDGDLYAFVEIPAPAEEAALAPEAVLFYAQDSSLSDSLEWLDRTLNEMVKTRRLEASNIDPATVALASRRVPVKAMGLMERDSSGTVIPAVEQNQMLKIFLPFGAMMFMFMVIFMSSQPMLESVLEEKSQRIAEVLLGSASPFQLMAGKLVGTVGGSMTVLLIYLAGVLIVAQRVSFLNTLPLNIVPWFIVFQILGVLFFAAIFMAVGSSVNQLKEAQSMLMPVWMMMMAPMFVWILILRSPNGALAKWLSLFPPATPTTMVMRLATGVNIPLWQLVLGVVLLAGSTVVVVFLAGRIFRAGILWQGKTPKFTEILRWAISG